MSKSPELEFLPGWLTTLMAIVIIFSALFWGAQDPVLPDEDDCAARGKPADCWKTP